ncbi:hypothetical protein ACOI1C_12480 [Bacillus sp. DJP31]|uniref:hypothetical protein n=1 Tax=Bacillus sp. DJP31 TaxID=3409789 RepID=UPI003BB6FB91
MLGGITAAVVAGSLVGCQGADIPEQPNDPDCNEWEWDDDDGVYECEDTSSGYYGHYFYGGSYYRSKSALLGSSSYKNYKSSSSFQGGKGFGSGQSSYGG